jgi:cellulose binding protein with CBM3 domain
MPRRMQRDGNGAESTITKSFGTAKARQIPAHSSAHSAEHLSQVRPEGAVERSVWDAGALAQLETVHSRRRFRKAASLALWLLCACGRIGYDGTDPFDGSATREGSAGGDVAVSPGSDASEDRPGAAGSGGGADVTDAFEEPVESGVTFLDGPLTADQGEGSSDAAICGSTPFTLLHWNVSPNSTGPLDLEFKISNTTGQTIPASSLNLRYYLTNEFTMPTLYTCYTEVYGNAARTGFNASVTLALQSIASPTNPTATSYIEVGFDSGAGVLLAGDTIKFEIGLVGNGGMQSQTNDYSYVSAARGTQNEWDQCPAGPGGPKCAKYVSCVIEVYKDGILVWGTPP